MADDVATFVAAAQAAANDLLRARRTSGIAQSDPLDPLVVALARTIGVLGQYPAAVRAEQQAVAAASAAEVQGTLSSMLTSLVAESGGDLARAEGRRQGRYFAIAAAIALIAVGGAGFYLGRSATEQKLEDNYHNTIISLREQFMDTTKWATGVIPRHSDDGAPYPCIGWGPNGWSIGHPGYVELQPVVTCEIALRYNTVKFHGARK